MLYTVLLSVNSLRNKIIFNILNTVGLILQIKTRLSFKVRTDINASLHPPPPPPPRRVWALQARMSGQ
jgi:hypothetical protein